MKVVIVNGQGGSGKTTFEDMIIKYATEEVRRYSIIDPIKDAARQFGYDESNKDLKSRKFLCDLKALTTEYSDYPYQYARAWIRVHEDQGCDLLFIDAREPEDILRFVKDYCAITVLINKGEKRSYGNYADDSVYDGRVNYDYEINNNGTLKELKEKAIKFYEQVKEK